MINISPMQEGEEQQTYELILRAFHNDVAPVYAKTGIKKFLGMISSAELRAMRNGEDSFVIVAKEQSKIIGMLAVINKSHIALIFVDPENQEKGVGRQLIDKAIKKCLDQNFDLSAITVSASPNSKKFYETIGFIAQESEINEDGMRFTPMKKLI